MTPPVIVVIGDGMADWPIPDFNNQTPLAVARTPYLDKLAEMGQVGRVSTIPDGMEPGSDVAHLGILGMNPRQYYTGRAPLEAAAMEIVPQPTDIIARCNLVTIEEGVMRDFTADHISTAEAAELLAAFQPKVRDVGGYLYPGVSYRHIVVIPDSYADIHCHPPHNVTDKPIAEFLPTGKNSAGIREWMLLSESIFRNHPVNVNRIASGKKPATHIWIWGQGKMPTLPKFHAQFGRTGGMVTAVDLLKGIGRLIGFETPDVPGATGFLDTNYAGKVDTALDMLTRHQFVLLHVEAPDETGHMGRSDLKIQAIEDFDQFVIGPLYTYLMANPGIRLWVLPDHATPCALKTHSRDPVPMIVAGAGIVPDSNNRYSEVAAESASIVFDAPWDALNYVIGGRL